MKPAAKDPDGEEGDVDAGGEAGYDVQSPEEQAALQELMACQEQLAEVRSAGEVAIGVAVGG